MSGAPRPRSLWSLAVFDIYVLALSLSLLVWPCAMLPALGIPPTDEVWVRVSGLLLLGYFVYYLLVVAHRVVEFLRFTLYVRGAVIVFFSSFVLLGWAPMVFLLFGGIDLLAALWTAWELRREGRPLHPFVLNSESEYAPSAPGRD